jgi:polyisoprenoid-binding protein YceI
MKKFSLALLAFVFLALPAAADDNAAHYYIPPSQFNAALQIMDLGFSNVFGLFRNATGSLTFDPSAKSIGDVKLAIDATSLTANSPDNEQALESLLAAGQYPEIDFVARDEAKFSDGKADIKGNLTLHGISKPVTLQATLNHVGKSPNGGGMWSDEGEAVGLSLRGDFKRADFGMTGDPNAPARFGDTMTLMLETQAIKQ